MTVLVRRALPADRAVLSAFNHAMAQESEDKGLDRAVLEHGIAHLFDSPEDGFYLVAETDSAVVVGALLVTFEWSDWRNGRFWWIQSVFVDPGWRRRGVYRQLHEWVRDAALDDRQACGLRLYVEKQNVGAQATYREMGMDETHYQLWEEDFNTPD